MKKFLTGLSISLVLFGNVFISKTIIAATTDRRDTENAITASHSQNKTLMDKLITSERHRYEESNKKPVPNRSDKKSSKVSWQEHVKIKEVIIEGNKDIKTSELRSILKPYLKRGVTKKEANSISDRIEQHYYKNGYSLPVAHIDIVESTLKILIIEGKVRNVVVNLADKKRDKKVLKNKLFLDLVKKIEKANPLKAKDLERYLLLINKIHGYTTEYEFKPVPQVEGNKVADLIMNVSTERGKANILVNNHGTSDLGEHQVEFSSQFYNSFSNDSIMLNLGTSDKPDRFQLITAGYLKRLNSNGTSASILFSYLKDDPNITDGASDNKTMIVKGRLDHYVILNNDRSVKLELGIEKRDTRHYFDDNKTSDYNYVMGSVGAKIKLVDPLNVENWFFSYFNWALNKVDYDSSSTEDRDFDRDFNYFVIDWYRDQALPRDFSFFLKASYQKTGKLLPREHRYSINTSNTARGYDPGVVSADQGISGKVEIRYTREIKKPSIKRFLNLTQVFGFYDITHFIDHNTNLDRTEHDGAIYFTKSTLSGVGFGVRLFFPYEIYAEATGEFPTTRKMQVNDEEHRNKPIFRFLISKEFSW